jgi:hypothetical protein
MHLRRPKTSAQVIAVFFAVALTVSPLVVADAGPEHPARPARVTLSHRAAHRIVPKRHIKKHKYKHKHNAGAHRRVARRFPGAVTSPLAPNLATIPVTVPPATSPTTEPVAAPFALGDPGITQLQVGITHTQKTANSWNPADAVARARTIINQINLQNEMLMGWGPLSPEPSPGVYDFDGLDARLSLIRSTGGTPVMTLCGAPDWMKGGRAGVTDWSKLADAPRPEFYDDFAQLAVKVAKRYPDIHYFQVWSELKGFYNSALNRWDYEAYTKFYNTVYDALKAYNPALRIGGPYVVFDSWVGPQSNPSSIHGSWGRLDQRPLDVMTYWLAHKHGADFVAIDGNTAPKDATRTANPFDGVAKLAEVTRWVKSRTSLPIWWSEVYPVYPEHGKGPTVSRAGDAAVTAYTLMALAQAGASVALLWQEPHVGFDVGPCMWTDTEQPGGGELTPTGTAILQVANLLVPGASVRTVNGLPPGVFGYAVDNQVVLINTMLDPSPVLTPAGIVPLDAHGVTVVPLA